MTQRKRSCRSVSGVEQQFIVMELAFPMMLQLKSQHACFCVFPGLVLNPDPESDSEDSDTDDPDDLVIPSPEMDDVKGERACLI